MVEWNGGVDYWSGVLDWITRSATPINAQFGPISMATNLTLRGWQGMDELKTSLGDQVYLASHGVRMRLPSETHLLTCIAGSL